MAITLVETVGSDTANTWATLAEANAYLAARLNVAVWESADDEAKKAALVQAARRLSLEVYQGAPVTATQALAFPRTGVTDALGNEVAPTALPPGVKEAQIEEALALVRSPARQDPSALSGFASLGIGGISLETRNGSGSTAGITPTAAAYLRRYRVGGSGLNLPLVRG